MIPVFLQDVIEPDYWAALLLADATGDYTDIQAKLDALTATDRLMQPFAGESGTKYYKPFVQTTVPKILPAIREAIMQNKPPEITVSFSEIDKTRARLGIGAGQRTRAFARVAEPGERRRGLHNHPQVHTGKK